MPDINDEISAWLEKRDAERIAARLQIKFRPIEKKEADRILTSGDFGDIFSSGQLMEEEKEDKVENTFHGLIKDAFTENISISGLKLVGDLRLEGGQAFKDGDYLLVEITIPDAPMPVRTLATVIWTEADKSDPVKFTAGLFFVGINRMDVSKVARFLVLQRRAKQG